jgi:hypothetical protein
MRGASPLVHAAVVTDGAIQDVHRPRSRRRDIGFVGDEHDGAAGVVQFGEQAQDVCGRRRVQISGRLIRKNQRRIGHQRTGDGHPLLLATGQLPGTVLHPMR